MIKTLNLLVATEPFESTSIKVSVESGVTKAKIREGIIKLKLVFDYIKDDIQLLAGDIVAVKTEVSAMPFAKAKYNYEGKEFILIPFQYIVLVEQGPTSKF